jgi:metal-responsive CopG/Arc/MetJ family transcriptional regulator
MVLYVSTMPTEKPKILITLESNLITRIDDYRFNNRINSRSEAIRKLLEEALSAQKNKAIKK